MGNVFLTPSWFFGYDIVFELAFAIIALFVSFYSYKIYKLTSQRQFKLFSISFLFIGLSYLIQSFLNLSIISTVNKSICDALKVISISNLNSIGILVHITLFIIGLSTLAYMTLKTKNIKLYSLMIILIFLTIFFSAQSLYMFYLVASVLLGYILFYYLKNYLSNKKRNTLIVFIGFAFMFFSHIHFIFSVNHALFYAIGHILEFVAYLLILINLIMVFKK